MKKRTTELVFILDISGSMNGLEADSAGGFNRLLEEHKKIDGDVTVSTVFFNHRSHVFHNRIPIEEINPLHASNIRVHGTTALLDAIGRSIRKIRWTHNDKPKELRPDSTIFVVMTDGFENASYQFTYEDIKYTVNHMQELYGWEFIFLGADITTFSEASKMGFKSDRVARFEQGRDGTRRSYDAMAKATSEIRTRKNLSERTILSDDWDQ
jgi:uncharacterized protein YegL